MKDDDYQSTNIVNFTPRARDESNESTPYFVTIDDCYQLTDLIKKVHDVVGKQKLQIEVTPEKEIVISVEYSTDVYDMKDNCLVSRQDRNTREVVMLMDEENEESLDGQSMFDSLLCLVGSLPEDGIENTTFTSWDDFDE